MTLRTKFKSWLRRLLHAEEGINLVLLAGGLTVLIGMAGVAVDGSNIYFQRQRMQIAADAAALGGARQLAINATLDAVDAEIHELAFANAADRVEWQLSSSERGVDVQAYRTFQSYFARIMGYNDFTVNARAHAEYEPVTGVDGLFPLTLSCDCVDDEVVAPGPDDDGGGESTPPGTPTPTPTPSPDWGGCDLYPIALDTQTLAGHSAGDSLGDIFNGVQPGNFGWLTWDGANNTPALIASLTPPGNSGIYTNPNNADDHLISIGDIVQGAPGVMNASDVRSALDTLMTMDIAVPVWDQAGANGSNSWYRVVGFALVRITDYQLPSQNRISATYLGPATCISEDAPGGIDLPTSATMQLNNGDSSYQINLISHVGNDWTYEVNKLEGQDLSYWMLDVGACLDHMLTSNPAATALGMDAATNFTGIKWGVASGFSAGLFSFSLDGDYAEGTIAALAKVGADAASGSIAGPICDDNSGGGGTPGGGAKICLPTIDFETDAAGAALVAGQVIDTEWAAWGVRVASNSQASNPAMIFDSAAPTGGDTDLGTSNQAYGGPGVGSGGGNSAPGKNNAPLGKTLIIQENSTGTPDDNAGGGTLIFTFNYGVNIDDVQIVDIDDHEVAGTVKAYSDAAGSTLIATGDMLGLGDNSVQTVQLSAADVRRLEVDLPASGAIASVISCRGATIPTYDVGQLIWADDNANGIRENDESGIGDVVLELYASGLNQVVATATTNTGGGYIFRNLPAGNYEVKVADSNFAANGPLQGYVFSPKNYTTDSKDSDFNSTTKRAPASVPLNGNDYLGVDGGLVPPASQEQDSGTESATLDFNDSKNTTVEISLAEHTGNTWTYRVREISGRDLKDWTLGIGNCVDHISQFSPTGASIGSSSGLTGIKWSVSTSYSDGYFSVTMDNSYGVKTVQTRAKNTKNATAEAAIIGPDCDAPALPVDYQNINFGNCLALKNQGKLPYTGIAVNGAMSTAGITNNSSSYVLVGMASYRKFDEIIDNQDIFDFMQYALAPGKSVSLIVGLPVDGAGATYATQIDVFCDEVLPSLNGQRYDDRKFGYAHIGGTYWAQPLPEADEQYCGPDDTESLVLQGLSSQVQGTVQVEAVPSGSPQRVVFDLSGPASMQSIQNAAPFCLQGDSGGVCNGWDTQTMPDGAYTLKATAWGIFGISLEAPCGSVSQSFSINNSGNPSGGSGGTTEAACSFHWVDWNGGGSSNVELQSAMNDVSVSGVWRLHEVIPAGPDVAPSLVLASALDGRVGETVKIPLAQDSGNGYAVCGFANVKLVDYSLAEGDIWVVLQFLNKVVRGVETDPAADDYGARDVRFHD